MKEKPSESQLNSCLHALEDSRKRVNELGGEVYLLGEKLKASRSDSESFRAMYERATYDLRRAESRVDALQFALVLAQEYAKKHQDESVRLKAEMKRLFKESRDTVALAS